jgi:hypothetical protein
MTVANSLMLLRGRKKPALSASATVVITMSLPMSTMEPPRCSSVTRSGPRRAGSPHGGEHLA